jgi:hypothetical protein
MRKRQEFLVSSPTWLQNLQEDTLSKKRLYEIIEMLNGHSCAKRIPTLFAELLARRLPENTLLKSLAACSDINAEMVPQESRTTFPPDVRKGYVMGDIDLTNRMPGLILKLYRHARYYYIELQGKIVGFAQTYRPSAEDIVFLGMRVFEKVGHGIGTEVMRWAAEWAGRKGSVYFSIPC